MDAGKISIGRIVHFYGGKPHSDEKPCAAMVVDVLDVESGKVALSVYSRHGGRFFAGLVNRKGVQEKDQSYWEWPPRA